MRAPIILFFALVASCVGAPPRGASVPEPVAATPPPRDLPTPVAADWRDWPVTPGTWRYAGDARGSAATFGRVGADALAVLRCDRAGGRLLLSVAGATPGPSANSLTVRTSSLARTLPTGATGDGPAYLAAALTPADPLLDAMAFSRGRFALSSAGAPPLVLPAWAEVGRVVEDCRP